MAEYMKAVDAILHGPKEVAVDLHDHGFNAKPAADSALYGNHIVMSGQISHRNRLRPDDQCYYTITAARDSVIRIDRKYAESDALGNAFAVVVGGTGIVVSVFAPLVGECLIASSGAVDKCVNEINHASDSWKDVCDNLLAVTAVALADWFGRSTEWIPVRTPPPNAIIGGHISDTSQPVYIGRALDNGNLHPGKVAYYNEGWHCYIGNGGREERYDRYEILVGSPSSFKWSSKLINKIPYNAVEGGHISNTPYPVYVGRAYDHGNAHPGKVAFYNNVWCCFIGNGGGEQQQIQYEVLLRA